MPVAWYADGTSGSTDLPANVCTRQQLIDWAQGIQARSTTGLGALEGVTGTGIPVAASTTPGAESWSLQSGGTAASVLEDAETLTAAGAATVARRTSKLNAASGTHAMTLGNGTYDGQEKHFIFSGGAASTAAFVFSAMANLVGGTAFTLDAVSYSMKLKWDVLQTKWVQVGGNCVIS